MIKLYNILPEHVVKPKRSLETLLTCLEQEWGSVDDTKKIKNKTAHSVAIDLVKSKDSDADYFSVYRIEPSLYYCILYSDTATKPSTWVSVDTNCRHYDIVERYVNYKVHPHSADYSAVKDFHDITEIRGRPVARTVEELENLP